MKEKTVLGYFPHIHQLHNCKILENIQGHNLIHLLPETVWFNIQHKLCAGIFFQLKMHPCPGVLHTSIFFQIHYHVKQFSYVNSQMETNKRDYS